MWHLLILCLMPNYCLCPLISFAYSSLDPSICVPFILVSHLWLMPSYHCYVAVLWCIMSHGAYGVMVPHWAIWIRQLWCSIGHMCMVPHWAKIVIFVMWRKEMSGGRFEPRSIGPKPSGLTTRPPRLLCLQPRFVPYYPESSVLVLACIFCFSSRGTDLNFPGFLNSYCHGRLCFCFAQCKKFSWSSYKTPSATSV